MGWCDCARKIFLEALAIVQKILYIEKVGIQKSETIMTLFKLLRLLTSTPLDAVEDENCGDAPAEEDKTIDNRSHQVESLAAEPSHSDPNALPMHAVKSIWEGIGPGHAQRSHYNYTANPKKVVIKKK